MANILIPTDFTTSFTATVNQVIQFIDRKPVNIILFHAFEIPFYVQDIFTKSARQPYSELLTDEFRQACKQLKDQHPKAIGKIGFKCMHGSTAAVFRNFIDANDVDAIICPDDYVHLKVHERSVDPTSFFAKAGIPVINNFKPVRKHNDFNVITVSKPQMELN